MPPSPLVWQETKGKNYVWLDGGDPWFKAHSPTLDLTTQPTSSQAFSLFRNPSLTSGFPWWSSNWDSTPPLLGAQVRSLIRELRSQKSLSSAAKKKKNLPKAQTLHGWVGGWCLNSSLWFQERWICRVENRASFHRHFLSTYCVPTPSTNVCTSERRPWAVRGSQLWREGSHHSGGRTYTFPEEVLFGQSWRVVGAVLGVRQGKPGEGGVEAARGRTAGTLTWINRHGGGRRRRSKSWRRRRIRRRRPLEEERRRNTLRPLEG